ncbi:hypothetical protein [Mobiluncus mulieris]|uniref:hypothetical protein n=1 Tax=Mobiluncus mulieris TaxID=2052 RepID=UPI0021E294CD|nr:hypothetical protein [Mobiluncus mulieris]
MNITHETLKIDPSQISHETISGKLCGSIGRVHGHLQSESHDIFNVVKQKELRTNQFPTIHILSQFWDGTKHIDGQNFDTPAHGWNQPLQRLTKRNKTVLSSLKTSSSVDDGIGQSDSTGEETPNPNAGEGGAV